MCISCAFHVQFMCISCAIYVLDLVVILLMYRFPLLSLSSIHTHSSSPLVSLHNSLPILQFNYTNAPHDHVHDFCAPKDGAIPNY